jgi:hypothetical protein
LTDYDVTFHTQANADAGTDAIANTTAYVVTHKLFTLGKE